MAFLTVSVQGHEVPFQPSPHLEPLYSQFRLSLYLLSGIVFFSLIFFFFILEVISHFASHVGLKLTMKSPSWLHTVNNPPASVSQVPGFTCVNHCWPFMSCKWVEGMKVDSGQQRFAAGQSPNGWGRQASRLGSVWGSMSCLGNKDHGYNSRKHCVVLALT